MAPSGAWAAIRALLAAPAIRLDAADGGALLRAAAATGQVDIAQRLLALGADPNVADPQFGSTALMAAAGQGNTELVRELLAHGADVNAVNAGGVNVMTAAAPHPEVVKVLVDAGFVTGPTDTGGAPLLPKYMNTQPDLALRLITAGVGLQDRDRAGNSLLSIAAHLGCVGMMQAILQASPAAAASETELAAAAAAAVGGRHVDSVGFLLHHGLKATGAEGQKVVAAASDAQILRQLFDLGFSARAAAGVGNDALVSAAAAPDGDTSVLRLLLEHGADSNAEGMEGNRPLVEAARLGSINAVKLLLAHGANAHLANRDGVTPLMAAADRGFHEFMNSPRTVAEPVMGGSIVGARPPRAEAIYAGNGMMLSQVMPQHPPADRQVHPALAKSMYPVMMADITFFTGRETPGIVSALLDAGAGVDAKDADGRTALMRAAAAGYVQNTQLLLAHGASRGAKNGQGETAAGIAAAFHHEQLADLLSPTHR
jgi:ankyrin repeat protein